MDPRARTVIITRATAKPGHLQAVADLFAETNPQLVANQPAWLGASFTAEADEQSVTVLAYWENADAYRAFSESEAFKAIMTKFAAHLAGPPKVTVSKVLVGMSPDAVWRG